MTSRYKPDLTYVIQQRVGNGKSECEKLNPLYQYLFTRKDGSVFQKLAVYFEALLQPTHITNRLNISVHLEIFPFQLCFANDVYSEMIIINFANGKKQCI